MVDSKFKMNVLLRRLLVCVPWLFKLLNRILPDSILLRFRSFAERFKYSDVTQVHQLPGIFHYWRQKHFRPMLTELGYSNLQDFFLQHILRFAKLPQIRLLSIGAGNCEADIELVAKLRSLGHSNILYQCLEFNPNMLERARTRAREVDVAEFMLFTELDVAKWSATGHPQYHVIISRQFLHHVVELEQLLLQVKLALTPDGLFLVEDMVGRNGHMRWPEALELVEELWATLPDAYKRHHLHGTMDRRFRNWDSSITGYEGIRAQDILPLLHDNFGFETFIAYGNIIDVFIGRPYGPNFDVNKADDLAFIDKAHQIDQLAIDEGRIKPTHIVAAMQPGPVSKTKCYRGITPEFAIRPVT